MVHQCDLEHYICCQGSPLFSLNDGTIKRYYVKTEYTSHFISGTIEGNDARAVMWEGYQLEHTSIPLWLYFNDGTKLQLEDVLSHVISIPFHSLESLSLALSAADWLLRNTNEGTPFNAITTLSEAFGTESFTISIICSWIFNSGESLTRVVPWPSYYMNGWHQILEKIKQFGTKTGVRFIDLAKYVATTDI